MLKEKIFPSFTQPKYIILHKINIFAIVCSSIQMYFSMQRLCPKFVGYFQSNDFTFQNQILLSAILKVHPKLLALRKV